MCPQIRLFNPGPNPPRKPWTYDQAASRKRRAEQFTREVLEDDDRAEEIAAMSVEDYAASRGKQINPRGSKMKRKVSAVGAVQDADNRSSNPAVEALQTATRALDKQNELQGQVRKLENKIKALELENKKLDAIADILDDDDPSFTDAERIEEISELIGYDEDEDEEK